MKKISAVLLLILLFVCTLGFSACSSPSAQNNNGTEPPEKTETIKYLVTVVDGVGSGEFEKGATVTVIADVKSDKTFVGWSDGENIISNDLTYTFVLKGNITLFATYKDNASVTEYKVIVKTDGIHSETFIVEKGDSISLIAQNKAGYAFEKWIDGNGAFVSSKSVATYYPTKDITIIAQYKMVYSVNVVNGTVAGQSANNQYKEGTKLTISANQVDGKYFAGWYVDSVLVSENNPYIFEVTENVIITAVYEDIQVEKTYYTVVVYADGVTATQTTIEENKQCTVQANAPEGKKFVGWYVNSVL
ncbi:MAG: InlB B-repeat-containing protein, partial [Clostridia bacterium]|nr:InlB B-repeat-containing protein [Clostridia bacterium]